MILKIKIKLYYSLGLIFWFLQNYKKYKKYMLKSCDLDVHHWYWKKVNRVDN